MIVYLEIAMRVVLLYILSCEWYLFSCMLYNPFFLLCFNHFHFKGDILNVIITFFE